MGGTLFTLLVLDPTGAPVEGAVVVPSLPQAALVLHEGTLQAPVPFRTDETGSLEVPWLPADPYDRRPRGRAGFRRRGLHPVVGRVIVWKQGHLPALNEGRTVQLVAAEPVTIPVQGAEGCELVVTARKTEQRPALVLRAPIRNGRAELPFLPDRQLGSQVRCEGFREAVDPGPLQVEPGRSVEVRAEGAFAQLTSVHAHCGERELAWKNPARNGAPVRSVVLDQVVGEHCSVAVQGVGADGTGWQAEAELAVGPRWDLALQPEAVSDTERRRVRVVDGDGQPVVGARVLARGDEVLLMETGATVPAVLRWAGTTDEEGFADIRVLPGMEHVSVLAEGYGRSEHVLRDTVSLEPAPGASVALSIEGAPAGEACTLTAIGPSLAQVVPVQDGQARFWAPPGEARRVLRCATWERTLEREPSVPWGRTVRVESERPFERVGVRCPDRSVWTAPTNRTWSGDWEPVHTAELVGVSVGPCELQVIWEDGTKQVTSRELADVWTLHPTPE